MSIPIDEPHKRHVILFDDTGQSYDVLNPLPVGLNTPFLTLRSVATVNWIGAIVLNAMGNENLANLAANKIKIRRVRILADINHGMNIIFWGRNTFATADPDTNPFRNVVRFLAVDGFQIGGAGLFYYDSGNLEMPYQDLDALLQLHTSLQITAVNKAAGAGDRVVIEVDYERSSEGMMTWTTPTLRIMEAAGHAMLSPRTSCSSSQT